MKVLVVGGGGREHAICWKLAQSPKVTELYCAPGNGGIAQVAACVPIKATDVDGMVQWARENTMDFVMVAPDDPLALGMTQAEVEAILPMVSGSESEAMGTTYAYFGTEPENQVYVGFMDGVATTLSVGGNFQTQQPLESSNWSLEGVTLGAKRADVEKALGKPTKEEPVPITGADGETTVAEGQVTLQYYYDADDKLMTEDTQNAKKVVGILLNGDKVQSFGTFTLVQSAAAAPTQDEAPEATE